MRFGPPTSFPGEVKETTPGIHGSTEIPRLNSLVKEPECVEDGTFAGRIGTDEQVEVAEFDMGVPKAAIISSRETQDFHCLTFNTQLE